MKSVDDIRACYLDRKRDLGPTHAAAMEVRDVYNGDVVVPLPEVEENEKVAVANLIKQALDQTAMRIASTVPSMDFPALRRGIKKSEDYARIRKFAVMGWHERNHLNRQLYRRARWLIGYGSAPVMIRPGKDGIPRWHLRDPLQTYPAPTLDPDELHPPDTIFGFKRSREWLRASFPDQYRNLKKYQNTRTFQLLEYVDEDELVLLVVGDEGNASYDNEIEGWSEVEELVRTPNRAGMPTAVCPGRIALDRPSGQYEGTIGIYQAQARMFALLQLATERSIFPEEWIVSGDGRNAQVVTEPDAKSGVMGKIQGGDIKIVQPQPGVFSMNLLNQYEESIRQSGAPAQYGGQGPSNSRTARAANATLSNAVDFYIAQEQTTFEESLKIENKIAIATAKGYFGNTSKTFYINNIKAEYTPNVHFETDEHRVRYAFAGADMDGQIIAAGQRIGMGTLSKRAFMENDPMVHDVEANLDEITVEGLRAAFMSSIQTQAADPAGPYQPADFARLVQLVRTDKLELEDAVAKLQAEIQERQAAAEPEQPGLAMPGAPGAPPEAVPPVAPSVANLAQTLGKLRQPQMRVASER